MFDTGENLADADSAVGNNNNGYHENEHRSCDEAATNPATPRSRRTQSCEFIHYEHQMRHHYGNSPGVDSLEVSALTPDLSSPAVGPGKVTSTPRSRTETSLSRCSSNVRCSSAPCDHSRTSSVELGTGEGLKMPIVGYEVMEQREKFTVFKIHVVKSQFESWFIFRRYTDFERLNDKLKILFPYFRLALPPKRWFSDNFDTDFLEDRMLGLQAFVDNITGHRDMLNSKTVIDFFCLEDPPGPHDSLEESRARCQDLEESVYSLRQELKERETTIELLRDQLAVQAAQIDHLNKSLRVERSVHSRVGTPVSVKNISLTEPDKEMQVEGKREGGAGSNQS